MAKNVRASKIITHYFDEPFQYDGKTYTKLEMNFGRLRGKDIREVKKYFDTPDKIVPVLSMDSEFAACVAARAAGVPYEMMDELDAGDYLAIAQMAIGFLLASGYSKAEQAQLEEAHAKQLPNS